ncbi:MAG: hypothetical protein IJ013_05345 [Bacteroidaceae bacterium]|nr:hypothetical protein [Bacteroidaceae bacterium]
MKETVFQSPQLGLVISEIIEREHLVCYLHEEAHMGHTTIAKLKRGN